MKKTLSSEDGGPVSELNERYTVERTPIWTEVAERFRAVLSMMVKKKAASAGPAAASTTRKPIGAPVLKRFLKAVGMPPLQVHQSARLDALLKKKAEQEARIATLDARIAALDARIAALDARIAALEVPIAAMASDRAALMRGALTPENAASEAGKTAAQAIAAAVSRELACLGLRN